MGLRSELGMALCFDIQVQNGGIGRKARAAIRESVERYPPAHELELRQVIAEAVAEASRAAYRTDVRQRKMTVATGRGSVHGHQFLLEDWGLSEEPAPELA
jgi:histidinol-phosphate/aromatic aminotransferase/cobyric acid decarboxylase-like protein